MITDEQRKAIRTLLAASWFQALVVGTETVVFLLGFWLGGR